MFKRMEQRLVFLTLLLAVFLAASPGQGQPAECADEISVTSGADSGPDTLRQALVDICSGGVIALQASPITLTSAEILIDRDVTIQGSGAKKTTIQAAATPIAGNNRIFTISGGTMVTLTAVTLRHGNPGETEPGGAIQILPAADVTIEDSAIAANRGGQSGGAIQLQSATLSISNSEISENISAQIGVNTFGGGIAVQADSGDAVLSVNNSTISDNFSRNGGGISVWVGSGRTVNLTLSHCTIADNAIESGGAGSGLYAFVDTAGTFHVDVANCIVANGVLGGNFHAVSTGSVTIDRAYTLLQDSTLPDGGIDGNIDDAEPLLGALQDNGGPTKTQAPFAGSPAVDAGDPTFTAPPDYDQRGPGFPRVLGGRLDMGAHESFLPLFLPAITVR